MRVLLVSPLPPPSGGIASWTIRYKEYCDRNNIPTEIVNIAMTGKRAIKETIKKNFISESIRAISIFLTLAKKIKTFKPNIVHLNTSCSNLGLFRDAICMAISSKRVPTILHCRCNIEDQLTSNLSKKAFIFLVKKSANVIVLNDFSKEFVNTIEPNKAIYIPNFIDKNLISTTSLTINDKISNIIFVGHVEASKGVYDIFETAKLFPSINFTLVGAIRDTIAPSDIPGNVILAGRLSLADVKSKLIESDVFLFPSRTEGFSNALLEAMAIGLPCIASNVGANKLMLENNGGIVLNNCSCINIDKAIKQLESSEIRKSMSVWNIKKVKEKYVCDIVMAQYFNLYNIVLKMRENQ